MRAVGLLHLTDLHCGRAAATLGTVRGRDVSRGFVSDLTYKAPLEGFCAWAESLLREKRVDAIACTGDLGHQYETGSIEAGARYLSRLAEKLGVAPDRVIVCPGNHDVDQEAKPGHELDRFCSVCDGQGFTRAGRDAPAMKVIDGLPIVALNTCMGATEHAVHAPETVWEAVRQGLMIIRDSAIKSEEAPHSLRDSCDALDIPAIANSQIEAVVDFVDGLDGDVAVVLAHHSVLPVRRNDIRPYAQMVNAGTALSRLTEGGRRILYLHGHSHYEEALAAFGLIDSEAGFLVALGATGFYGDEGCGASYVQVLLDKKLRFLVGNVFPISQAGDGFRQLSAHRIQNRRRANDDLRHDIDPTKLGRIPKGKSLPFPRVAKYFPAMRPGDLAVALLRSSVGYRVEVRNVMSTDFTEWEITRL